MKNIFKILIVVVIIIAIAVFIYFMLNKNSSTTESIEYNYYKYYSNEKFGVIDKSGNVLIEANYQDIIIPNPTYPIFFLLENSEIKSVVNDKNEQIFTELEKVSPIPVTGLIGDIPYEKHVLIYEEDGKLGLLNLEGKKLTKANFDSIESLPYKEGELLCKNSENVFVLQQNGKEKIKLDSGIEIVADGYYLENNFEKTGYIISDETSNGMMYGYINYNGKQILDLEFDKIERVLNDKDYLIVMKNGQYGLYQNDNVIINCNYQDMKYEDSINMYFVRRGNSYGVLNENGDIIVPVEYQNVENKGIFIEAVNNDNQIEHFNLNGEKTNQFDNYNSITKSKYDNTYIGILNDYSYQLLDSNYNALTNEQYEYMENILSNVYIVRDMNGKYGVINNSNQKLINNNYDVIQLINNTEIIQAMDVTSNMISLFNKSGEKLLEEEDLLVILSDNYIKVFCNEGAKYYTLDGRETSNTEIYSNNNIIGFYENGKWGFKDKSGNIVIEAQYDRIAEINGNGYGGIKLNDLWGIIYRDGNIIVEPKFYIDDNISDPEFLNRFYKNYYASEGAFYVE